MTERGAPAGEGVKTVPGWGFGALPGIAVHLSAIQPDIVHLQYQTGAFAMSPAVSLLPFVARAACGGSPVVTTFHDLRGPYLFPGAGKLRRAPARVLLGASDGCIFTSPEDVLNARPRRRAAWIPLGPGVLPPARAGRKKARERLHIDSRSFVIAYFGFMNSSKGVETLLHAAKALSGTDLDFRLLFIGEDQGSSDPTNRATATRIRALESQLDLESRVERTGWLPGAEISRALAAADVAALPYIDGASLRRSALITCFAHGVPVVTTTPRAEIELPHKYTVAPFEDRDPFRIDDGVAALVPPGDAEALAGALGQLAGDSRQGLALARGAKQLAARLAWPNIAAATVRFYEDVSEAAA